jgi:hypothetical protein
VSGTIDSLLLVQGFPLSVGGQLPKPSQFPGVAWIDRDDEVYSRLRAWTDINHNGRSEPNELHSLVDVDADRIYLTFRVIKSEDSLANIVALLGLFADFSYPRPTVDRDMALVRFAR